MIIPKEKPYMDGLNSYYLLLDNFIEHLQGEIGTGCIYFKSSTREILVYFDEMDIIGGVLQESGQREQPATSLKPVFEALKERKLAILPRTGRSLLQQELRRRRKPRNSLSKTRYLSPTCQPFWKSFSACTSIR